MKQIVRVRSNEVDANEDGREWQIEYVLVEDEDVDGLQCFDLFSDDGQGNGPMICRGYNRKDMRNLTLRLGEFVEWGTA